MGVDTLLNLGWALLCAGALVWHWRRERQQGRSRSRRVQLLRGLSVFLAALSLFPCISVSDDYARSRWQDTNSIPSPHGTLRNGNGTNLLGVQLEETEHIRPVAPFVLVLVLCCFLVILSEQRGTWHSVLGLTLGRAPPAF
jgi:hypothetical protein